MIIFAIRKSRRKSDAIIASCSLTHPKVAFFGTEAFTRTKRKEVSGIERARSLFDGLGLLVGTNLTRIRLESEP